ncbi:fam-m protein [Plasmodium malariae]|uniref:Fam-m protein n=1 Tax=Plasmodium malariae TaxID=5858 RepID=A0A1D3JGY2_PLAMA|nr:fam-m protein [Plasmodium malariae]SBT85439.1 fam-m protein [Plasmodium malariae]
MEQIIKLILCIKFSAFIILASIYHFSSDIVFNKSLNVKWNLDSISGAIRYRLLAKYKKDQDSNTVGLTEDISNNMKCKNINIYNNKKLTKGKNKQSNGNLLNKQQYYTEIIDYNNGMFDGKHFHFQKKWIKKKDFDDFVEKKRRICDIDLKKIKFRNYGFGFTLFFIFLFLGIGIPISPGLTFLKVEWTTIKENPLGKFFYDITCKLKEFLKMDPYVILYSIFIVILSVILIIAIYKILRNNEKYEKIKLMSE